MENLDNDFDQLVIQINKKLNEAAASLKEANELRKKAGLETFILNDESIDYDKIQRQVKALEETTEDPDFDYDEEFDNQVEKLMSKLESIDVSALEIEINNAGWSTSSSYC